MKYLRIILVLVLLTTCNGKIKEVNNKEASPVKAEKATEIIEAVMLPNKELWKLTNINVNPASTFTEYGEFHTIATIETGKSAYVALDNIKIPDVGGLYEITFLVGSTDENSSFGFRIQEVYPNRIDIAFNLKDQTVIGIDKIGDFIFEEDAKIEVVEENLYRITVNAEIYSNYVRVLFGPSAISPKVLSWESPKGKQESVYLIPESLKFNLISY